LFAKSNPAEVNEKLIKAFRDAFPLAEKVEWQENGNHYLVHFTENAVLSEIEYDHDGHFLNSVRYFKDPDLLPLHLSWELHKKFADKTIFGVTETTSEYETLYYIKLEDKKDWITVKATSVGSMEVVEKYQKQN
jgi:hypothetical protein